MPSNRPPKYQWPEVIELDVGMCPRCSGRHLGHEYRRFELGDPRYTHWAYCPATGEPLLIDMRVKGQKEPEKFLVHWVGTGRKATQPPNPNFPEGIDVTTNLPPGTQCCKAMLPYPAKEIGAWKVECVECGAKLGCTAAGRPDDPRSIIVPCRQKKGQFNNEPS